MNLAIIPGLIADHPALTPLVSELLRAVEVVLTSQRAGGWVYTCGNGGSAADADHIVGEFLKGFRAARPPAHDHVARLSTIDPVWTELGPRLQWGVRAMSLNAHAAAISAIANDQHPELVFAQQLYAVGRSGDVVIGLSTSGNARNVVRALQVARARGLRTIGLTGNQPCALDALCDCVLKAPASETYRVQEFHLPLYHALCALVEEGLDQKNSAA